MTSLTRGAILQALRQVFEPLPHVYAMWEGGAAAFDRVDEWSDIDLQFDVADDHADEVIPLVDATLSALSPVELRYPIQQPMWPLHAQVFYRLRDAGPFLLIDLAVLKHSRPDKLLEAEIHGRAVAHFDKADVLHAGPIDPAAWQLKLAERRDVLRVTFPLFQVLTLKELRRGNFIEAFAFYYNYTLRPLIELLRITHTPYHYNFYTRYVYYELPADVVQRLEAFLFVATPDELADKRQQAEHWFNTLVADRPSGEVPPDDVD